MALTAEQYLKPEVIRSVARLDLKARFIVEGFLSGLHRSPFHGFSVEFSEHRRYHPGDDIRLIDWNVYAKTDRYFIKKFQAETNLEAYLVMDCSASMGYATGNAMSKMDYAICLAAALGHLMIHQQDSVGLYVFDEKLREYLPPKSKRSHLTAMLSMLARTAPAGETSLGEILLEVASRVSKRSLILVLSDMISDQEAVIRGLQAIRYRGHDLILFQVLDHGEVNFEFDGPARFEDPETQETVTADAQAIRAAYLEEIRMFLQTYRDECRQVKADFVTVDNSMTFDKALREFMIQRQGRF
jgi:uncharacterized protein (DUF58 family)